jgi:hypothetical protein
MARRVGDASAMHIIDVAELRNDLRERTVVDDVSFSVQPDAPFGIFGAERGRNDDGGRVGSCEEP